MLFWQTDVEFGPDVQDFQHPEFCKYCYFVIFSQKTDKRLLEKMFF